MFVITSYSIHYTKLYEVDFKCGVFSFFVLCDGSRQSKNASVDCVKSSNRITSYNVCYTKLLRSRLKTQLFQRKGSKIYLTKAGKLTYRHLKDIKQQYRSLEFELGRLNDDFTGLIRIGASSTLSQDVIPSVIAVV